MSSINKGLLRLVPAFHQQICFGHNRPNIQKPRPPPFLKNKFLKVCEPIVEEDLRSTAEKCAKPQEIIPPFTLNALDKIYASEMRDAFKSSQLVAIFARTTSDYDTMHQAKILFFKANMKIVIRNKYIVKEAIGDTEFRNLLPVFNAANFVVFGPEPDISRLVQINQKLQKFHLLCAVVYGQILSVSRLEQLAAIPDIGTARAGIVQTLQSGAQGVVRNLQAHQNTLVQQLQQRVEQLQTPT